MDFNLIDIDDESEKKMQQVKSLTIFVLAIIAVALQQASVEARGFRVNLLPNGGENQCANCHVNPRGGGARDDFGQDVRDLLSPASSRDPFWGPELAALDSDEDGFTNGEELGDIDGDGVPERTVNITLPGNSSESPVAEAGDCNLDTELNSDDLGCVSEVLARDAVLGALGTLPGDLDGDGNVAFLDFLTLAQNFGSDSPVYSDGNIDLTGGVSFLDFLELARNFGKSPEEVAAAAPEPAGFLLSSLGVLALLRLRNSRRDSH